jgi:frataxin-like iron-binding protein CyaY
MRFLNNIGNIENTIIYIHNAEGRQVMNTTINEKQINVASLSSGIYIFDITNGKSNVGKGKFAKL